MGERPSCDEDAPLREEGGFLHFFPRTAWKMRTGTTTIPTRRSRYPSSLNTSTLTEYHTLMSDTTKDVLVVTALLLALVAIAVVVWMLATPGCLDICADATR